LDISYFKSAFLIRTGWVLACFPNYFMCVSLCKESGLHTQKTPSISTWGFCKVCWKHCAQSFLY